MTESTDAVAYEVTIKWTPENGNHGHPMTVISELHPESEASPYSGDSGWTILDYTPLGPLTHETETEVDFEVTRERLLEYDKPGYLDEAHGKASLSCPNSDCHTMPSLPYIVRTGSCFCGTPLALVLLSGEKPEDDE